MIIETPPIYWQTNTRLCIIHHNQNNPFGVIPMMERYTLRQFYNGIQCQIITPSNDYLTQMYNHCNWVEMLLSYSNSTSNLAQFNWEFMGGSILAQAATKAPIWRNVRNEGSRPSLFCNKGQPRTIPRKKSFFHKCKHWKFFVAPAATFYSLWTRRTKGHRHVIHIWAIAMHDLMWCKKIQFLELT